MLPSSIFCRCQAAVRQSPLRPPPFPLSFVPRILRSLSGTRSLREEFNAQAWLESFNRDSIPREELLVAFSRSGGPGGQNVNKVNTKVDMRFPLKTVNWVPEPVKKQIWELHGSKINKRAEFVVSSDRHRTQHSNLEDCIDKLCAAITSAAETLVVHEPTQEQIERIEEFKRVEKEKKIKAKERHGSKKAHRKGGRGDY
ncbi:Peptidyl-tRNA hydrolase ict1, mitochondrial [Geranomyces variabilis]|nr:Peptidyl-tRNA hydrolase ict1, mitochondrial [Geranomyces variabilis]